jgi:probable rRNA maturation factor
MNIDIQNPVSFKAIPDSVQLDQWLKVTQQLTKKEIDVSLTVRIVDEEEGQALNTDFRGKDYPTNVLSFPYEKPPFAIDYGEDEAPDDENYLGDLVICQPVVQKEAQAQEKTLDQHWAHLFVHGVLHLQGFDHISDAEAVEMETLEIAILGQLGYPNPY